LPFHDYTGRTSINGFSLIELLLGVSLFSVVALSAYGTFFAGVKLSRYAREADTSSREIRWAFDLISRELENAVFYDFSGSYPQRSAFEGRGDQITFILAEGNGLKAVSYYLAAPEDGAIHKIIVTERHARNRDVTIRNKQFDRAHYLVRKEMDFVDYLDETSTVSPSVEIITARVKESGLRFSYGYAGEDGLIWKDAWQGGGSIPQAVRVEMDALPAAEQQSPLKVLRDIFIPHGVQGKEDA
jgi:prepilin-type N-terminal cleavage/methylation domain-containing protein